MHTIDIRIKIFNPNREKTFTIDQYSSLPEAVEHMGGTEEVLAIINRHIAAKERYKLRNKMIDELFQQKGK